MGRKTPSKPRKDPGFSIVRSDADTPEFRRDFPVTSRATPRPPPPPSPISAAPAGIDLAEESPPSSAPAKTDVEPVMPLPEGGLQILAIDFGGVEAPPLPPLAPVGSARTSQQAANVARRHNKPAQKAPSGEHAVVEESPEEPAAAPRSIPLPEVPAIVSLSWPTFVFGTGLRGAMRVGLLIAALAAQLAIGFFSQG